MFPGEPLPSVEWYMDNEPIDQTFQQTYEGVVKNDLTIRHLKREHTLSRLRCLAKNNNLTKPVETSVTLKMLCKYPPPCYYATYLLPLLHREALKISKKGKFRQDGASQLICLHQLEFRKYFLSEIIFCRSMLNQAR